MQEKQRGDLQGFEQRIWHRWTGLPRFHVGLARKSPKQPKTNTPASLGQKRRNKDIFFQEKGKKKKRSRTFLIFVKRDFVQRLKQSKEGDCSLMKDGFYVRADPRKVEISLLERRIQGVS